MGSEFLKLGMRAADIAELGGPELGKVGLWLAKSQQNGFETYAYGGVDVAYVDVESQNRILLSCPLEAGDLGLELVLWGMLLLLLLLVLLPSLLLVLRRDVVVSR